jgi:predicted PurR-regulated permease PerM
MLVLVVSIIILIIRNEMKDIPTYPEEVEQQFVKIDTLLNRITKEKQQKQISKLQNKENINNINRIYIDNASNTIFPQSNVKATDVND